jgi:hypothetical protein
MASIHNCNTSAYLKINEIGVKGLSGGLDLCHFSSRKMAWL